MAAVTTKRFFIIAAAVLVALGGLLILPFLVTAELVGDAVKAEIRAVTGLDPILRGGASVSLFPSGRVSFENVTLGEDGGNAPALHADEVVARLRFFPFLAGRIEIADILLVRPTITIGVGEGKSNWSGQIEALAQHLNGAAGGASSVSEIRIEDGTVIVRDEASQVQVMLSQVEFALAWPSISRSFAGTGRFSWNEKPIDAMISFTDFAAALQGDRSGLKLRLGGEPFKLAFDGYISHRPSLKMEGTLAADTSSLRDALQWAGQQPPPGGGFGRFALKAQSNVVGSSLALSDVHVELDANSGEGVLTFGGRHALQGTIAANALDLSPYVSTLRLLAGGGERGWDAKPLALDGLDGMDIDLRLSAARVKVASANLGRTAVTVNLRGGNLTVGVGESEAFGGLVQGTFGLGKSPAGTEFKTQLQFSNVDLEQSLGEMFGLRRLEGKGNIGFAVEGSGTSVYELTKALNGTAGLSSRKGVITGFNVEQLLRRIERRPLSLGSELRSGKTPYDNLTLDLKITNGIAEVQTARVEGAAIALELSGAASIPARELDLHGTAGLLSSGSVGTPAFELPFMVQGGWDDPDVLLDPLSRIQRSGAAAPLLDAVRNRGGPAAVRSMIERLTGAPAPPPAPAATGPTGLAGAASGAPTPLPPDERLLGGDAAEAAPSLPDRR
ncbi:MAG: AsmA family protein [Xanthobacteraceae bacterium]